MSRALLITANVGSLFDDASRLRDVWLDNTAKAIYDNNATFVALHFQESGGKHFEDHSHHVAPLVSDLFQRLNSNFSHGFAYLDLDFRTSEHFTALGSVFFIDKGIASQTRVFDFKTLQFNTIGDPGLYIEQSINSCPHIRKEKFPKDFWPSIRWGRKGFLHSRWQVLDRVFDLVNVHFFHDDSNLGLLENATVYSDNRRKAMTRVLARYRDFIAQSGEHQRAELFVFGDFNFRLNAKSFLNKLTGHTTRHDIEVISDSESLKNSSDDSDFQPPVNHQLNGQYLHRPLAAVEFRRRDDQGVVLRIEKKKFDYVHKNALIEDWESYREDDKEAQSFPLKEAQITFPPTYPWSEDPDQPESLMSTRIPAWCDRVLMNDSAWSNVINRSPVYSIVGRNFCMGDHKPVFLSFTLS